MMLLGLGIGTAFTPMTSFGIAGVEPRDAGAASGLVNVSQQMGGSVGLGVLVTVFAAARIGHEHAACFHGRHAQQGIAQPFLPHALARHGEHFQLATLGIEDDAFVNRHRRRGTVVLGLILPGQFSGDGVQGVEFVTAEAAAQNEDTPAGVPIRVRQLADVWLGSARSPLRSQPPEQYPTGAQRGPAYS